MNPFLESIQGISDLPIWFLALLTTWILIWKGLALWKSARRGSSTWFLALLIINTMGILEILYFYLFSEMKLNSSKDEKMNKIKKPIKKIHQNRKSFLDN